MNTHYRHFRETFLAKNYTYCGVVNSKGNLMIGRKHTILKKKRDGNHLSDGKMKLKCILMQMVFQ